MSEEAQKQPTKADREALLNELEMLELEEKRERVLEIKKKRLEREQQQEAKIRHISQEVKSAESKKVVQGRCNHKKGGKGAEAVLFGQGRPRDLNDQYAINLVLLPMNNKFIFCTRCLKEWHPKDPDWKEVLDWMNYTTNTVVGCSTHKMLPA